MFYSLLYIYTVLIIEKWSNLGCSQFRNIMLDSRQSLKIKIKTAKLASKKKKRPTGYNNNNVKMNSSKRRLRRLLGSNGFNIDLVHYRETPTFHASLLTQQNSCIWSKSSYVIEVSSKCWAAQLSFRCYILYTKGGETVRSFYSILSNYILQVKCRCTFCHHLLEWFRCSLPDLLPKGACSPRMHADRKHGRQQHYQDYGYEDQIWRCIKQLRRQRSFFFCSILYCRSLSRDEWHSYLLASYHHSSIKTLKNINQFTTIMFYSLLYGSYHWKVIKRSLLSVPKYYYRFGITLSLYYYTNCLYIPWFIFLLPWHDSPWKTFDQCIHIYNFG